MQKIGALKNKCPECGHGNLVYDLVSGEKVCSECGLVLDSVNPYIGPERRTFTVRERESRSRVGLPLSYLKHDKGLSTVITNISRDSYGKHIPIETKNLMYRLRKLQNRSRVYGSRDRNLVQAMGTISLLTDRLNIPNTVKEQAALIYRKALNLDLIKGRSIASMAGASLYVACRLSQIPRTLDDVSHVSPIDKLALAQSYRFLVRELHLKMPIPSAVQRIPLIASRANVGLKSQQLAVDILREAKKNKLTSGKDPMGLAAASLYLSCSMNGIKKTQKTLASASGVTEVTIRNRYSELKQALKLDLKTECSSARLESKERNHFGTR